MTLTQAQREQIDAVAAEHFERSDDILAVTFAIAAVIERRKELRKKWEAEEEQYGTPARRG